VKPVGVQGAPPGDASTHDDSPVLRDGDAVPVDVDVNGLHVGDPRVPSPMLVAGLHVEVGEAGGGGVGAAELGEGVGTVPHEGVGEFVERLVVGVTRGTARFLTWNEIGGDEDRVGWGFIVAVRVNPPAAV